MLSRHLTPHELAPYAPLLHRLAADPDDQVAAAAEQALDKIR